MENRKIIFGCKNFMKAEEKQIIYNLLKTADAHNSGYTRDIFSVERTFEDDVVINDVIIKSPEIESINQPKSTIDSINAKISRCTRCGLARTRHNVVPGMGVQNPEVLVIGENATYEDEMQSKPFSGKAGILLDKMLNAINLDRNTNCYLTNLVKCHTPEERKAFPDEQNACFSFLEAQIHILKPKIILCLGNSAIEKLMNEAIPLTQYHGEFYDYHGTLIMATYAPKDLLANEELKRPTWEDLKKFRIKLNSL